MTVDLSGRRAMVVGAEFGDVWGLSAAGSAYVFLRDQGGPNAWGEAGKLGSSDADNEDRFGVSVAIDNSIAVFGADGDDDLGFTNHGLVIRSGDEALWSQPDHQVDMNDVRSKLGELLEGS